MSKRPRLNYDIEDMINEALPELREHFMTDEQLQSLTACVIKEVRDKLEAEMKDANEKMLREIFE